MLTHHFQAVRPSLQSRSCHRRIRVGLAASACLAWLALPLLAQVQLTEFMASNTRTLKDDFGQYEDWIELNNGSSAPVSLAGWALTDDANDLRKWRFPNTNLAAKSYLVVFASNRDRRVPGAVLHTNFRLDAGGEYLALVRPDGTVATEFAPAYPPQTIDVSYGFGANVVGTVVIASNATGRVLVPTEASLGVSWANPAFDDTGWSQATNGIGFESGPSDDPATVSAQVLADRPAGFWRLSEPSGALAANSGSVGATANGQALGGVTLGVPGPRPPAAGGFESDNRAARFNGTDGRIEIPYSPDLNPAGVFTVEAWAKPARTGGSPAWLVSSLNAGNGRSGYALAQDYSAKGQWEFRLGDTTGYIANAFGGSIDTNRWNHLAGVYDGTTARLYVNGVLAASATLSRPFEPNTAERFLISGRVEANNPYYYPGDLDEVSVIARALTAAEIAARYQTATNAAAGSTAPNYTGLIRTDLTKSLYGVNSSAYLRLPFSVTNAADLDRLVLRVKYDDGFVAYLNGQTAASANAPATPLWNSVATARHAASDAIRSEEFDLSSQIGRLRNGPNLLAVQGLNVAATNADFLLQAELELAGTKEHQLQSRYFVVPTPRNPNGTGTKDLGPILGEVTHQPRIPATNDSLTVTCRVTESFARVASVTLNWRVMFDALQTLPMFDDGQHGDGAAGDGVYGAAIPSRQGADRTYTAGQMVRWYVTATDTLGRSSRWPLFASATDSEEYLGTVVQPNYVSSKLPVFHLFAPPTVLQPGPNTQQIGADSEQGGRLALYYDGELYDNIYMELRGNTSAGLNKKAHRLEFNREHPFRHPGPGGRIRKSSLLAEHLDPAYLRQHLCFWMLDLMGVPSPFDYPVRTQLNGAFYQLAFHTDVLGEEQLERLGYDSAGALYKCAGQVNPQFSSTGGFQKLLPQTNLNDRADYLVLANGINESKTEAVRRTSVFDMFDVAEVVNYLAGARFCAENDDVWANMCLYRDTFGDGLWRIVPFDMNASWGQLYGGSSPLTATDDNSKSHPFYGGSQVQENGRSAWNRVYDVIVSLPETRQMLLRRQRTLLDTCVLPPSTPAGGLILESYIKQMTNLISAEALLDRQKWGFSPWAPSKTFPSGISDLLTQFVGPRRRHWYVTHCVTNTAKPIGVGPTFNAGIPESQPTNAAIAIVSWDANPTSGNQDEEYVCLTNRNAFAVDLSGWELKGGVQHTLRAGTVIPAGGSLYLSPRVSAFRSRASGPRGGQGLFVQGAYSGHLSAWGEELRLLDTSGRLVSSNSYTGNPSPAQRYLRITELMYNPPPGTGAQDPQSFEYLELKNISPSVTLDLAGVRLTNGVRFAFTGSAVTRLLPGQTALVVRDTQAFAARYGPGLPVAGQFEGALESAGEPLRLEDAVGEVILEFSYNNTWYPTTDGLGFSLVIVDEQAPWNTWGQKASWRPSGSRNGSPGASESAPPAIPALRITEVLAHPAAGQADVIELFNPTSALADISGWWLTDDPQVPAKYRLPAGTQVAPEGFATFTSDQFGAGTDGFRLSRYGDQVFVFSADAASNLTGYAQGVDFAYAPEGVTAGRHVTSEGEGHFVLQSRATLGTHNASPGVGPMVISEIMFRPPDLTNRVDNSLDEFIELQNIATTHVPLFCTVTNAAGYGARALTNTWRLRNAVDYDFPTNVVVAPDARLLVVGFDPQDSALVARFRSLYSVPNEVPLFGPWNGKLDNSGETIELKRPDVPQANGDELSVPYYAVERIAYRDAAPWPSGADGQGGSLQRRVLTDYGNDPANWSVARPTAGQVTTEPPALITWPTSHTIAAGTDLTLTAEARGSKPLFAQWFRNQTAVTGATNWSLSIVRAQRSDAGEYQLVVSNAYGRVASPTATILVAAPSPQLERVSFNGAEFAVSTMTVKGFDYVLEYKDNLNETDWKPLAVPLGGTDGLLLFRDLAPTAQTRFYRVRAF